MHVDIGSQSKYTAQLPFNQKSKNRNSKIPNRSLAPVYQRVIVIAFAFAFASRLSSAFQLPFVLLAAVAN